MGRRWPVMLALALLPTVGWAGGRSSGSHSSSSSHSSHHTRSSHSSSSHHSSSYKSSGSHSTGSHRSSTGHGKTKRDPKQREAFVKAHNVPLKRGGADSPSNMQWQTKAEAKAKQEGE